MERTVRRYWCEAGTNPIEVTLTCGSVYKNGADGVHRLPKKIAESTGRLPPTPILHTVAKEQRAI